MSKVKKAIAAHKIIFASVLALTIFGAVYGFAATLGVSSQTLSAGNTAVASCQTGNVTGSYTTAYDQTLSGFKVASVVVKGVSTACATKTVSVTLTDSSNNPLGGTGTTPLTGTVPAGGGDVTVTSPSSTVSAALVSNVNVAING